MSNMGDINMSLDDIIKKRFVKGPRIGNKFNGGKRKGGPPTKRPVDNQKKFQLNRGEVLDARLKLTRNRLRGGTRFAPAPDARFRLEALRRKKVEHRRPLPASVGILRRTIPGGIGMDIDSDFDHPGLTSRSKLLRTVENDRPFSRRPFDWDRPVEEEIEYERGEINPSQLLSANSRPFFRRPFDWDQPLEEDIEFERLKRVAANPIPSNVFVPDDTDLKGIKITVSQMAGTVGILKRPNSTLKGLKDVAITHTVHSQNSTLNDKFSSFKTKAEEIQPKLSPSEFPSKPELGHRIVVSNLVHSVTGADVQELFGDIGELISGKIVRPGVAEVVYHNQEDAVKAVDVYHNRQLDGQPMKCLLVKNYQAVSKKPKNVELDLATLRNALHVKKTP